MRSHATNGPVENLGRSAVVKGARLFGIDNMPLVKEVVVSELKGPFYICSKLYCSQMLTLFRKKLPEILISSHLTTTIFWPERICLDMIEASRPRRCPLPSITMGVEEKVAMLKSKRGTQSLVSSIALRRSVTNLCEKERMEFKTSSRRELMIFLP